MSLSGNVEKFEYRSLTRDRIEDVLAIQAETMKTECVAIGLGMFDEPGAPEEMLLVFREIVKDGATIIAVDKETDELAAVAFNKIHARPREGVKDPLEVLMEENLKHRSCQELVKFIGGIETSVDIFEKYNANGAMELFYIGTNPRYQGRGIGYHLVNECIEFGRRLLKGTATRSPIDETIVNEQVVPEIIFGVFASDYSQRIADKLGFESLHEARYDEYSFAGRKMSERIGGNHKTARLQVLKL